MESFTDELLQQVQPNRQFKDSLFRDLFGNPSRKENALELYNALVGTDYSNPDDLVLTTIEGTLYLGYRNDVSFILEENMMLWEHQSTTNPNMPLRGLMYLVLLIWRHLRQTGKSELSARRVRLPTPRYYVFYNGTNPMPERSVMRLSDSFSNGPGDMEVTVTVLNVNEGQNRVIMEACEALRGYAHLVALYREYMRRMPAREAMDSAVSTCIEDGLLVSYLEEKRTEVIDMLMTEWKEKEYHELIEREAREDGYGEGYGEGYGKGYGEGFGKGYGEGEDAGEQKGRDEVRLEFLGRAADLVRAGVLSLEDAASQFGFAEDELRSALES